jgi:hypothetical protein
MVPVPEWLRNVGVWEFRHRQYHRAELIFCGSDLPTAFFGMRSFAVQFDQSRVMTLSKGDDRV